MPHPIEDLLIVGAVALGAYLLLKPKTKTNTNTITNEFSTPYDFGIFPSSSGSWDSSPTTLPTGQTLPEGAMVQDDY